MFTYFRLPRIVVEGSVLGWTAVGWNYHPAHYEVIQLNDPDSIKDVLKAFNNPEGQEPQVFLELFAEIRKMKENAKEILRRCEGQSKSNGVGEPEGFQEWIEELKAYIKVIESFEKEHIDIITLARSMVVGAKAIQLEAENDALKQRVGELEESERLALMPYVKLETVRTARDQALHKLLIVQSQIERDENALKQIHALAGQAQDHEDDLKGLRVIIEKISGHLDDTFYAADPRAIQSVAVVESNGN